MAADKGFPALIDNAKNTVSQGVARLSDFIWINPFSNGRGTTGRRADQAQWFAGPSGQFNLATAYEFVTVPAEAPIVERFPFS